MDERDPKPGPDPGDPLTDERIERLKHVQHEQAARQERWDNLDIWRWMMMGLFALPLLIIGIGHMDIKRGCQFADTFGGPPKVFVENCQKHSKENKATCHDEDAAADVWEKCTMQLSEGGWVERAEYTTGKGVGVRF